MDNYVFLNEIQLEELEEKSHVTNDVEEVSQGFVDFSAKKTPQIRKEFPEYNNVEILQEVAYVWSMVKNDWGEHDEIVYVDEDDIVDDPVERAKTQWLQQVN